MKIIRWFAAAFSMFSRIPMPQFRWLDDDASRSLLFFPFVGAVIGAFVVLINAAALFAGLPAAVRVMLTLAAPLIITGGIHVDGFMDTEDAFNSYAPAEKKLEILKDPHTGAFAVISLVKWMLIYAAALTAIIMSPATDTKTLIILGLTFVISRCVCGLTSLLFKGAKSNGMLYELTKNKKRTEVIGISVELLLSCVLTVYLNAVYGTAVIVTFGIMTVFYRCKTGNEFGGVTGDTAGWFVTVSEIMAAVMLAFAVVFFRS